MTSSGNASGISAVDRVIHSLYIVQRPLEEDILRSAKALAKNSGGKLTEEDKLHCGVRSIDEVDHYRHDYHVAPDSRNNFVFIQKVLANTVSILKTGNKKPLKKFPNPLEKIGQVYMSADEIWRRASQLLKKFNGPQQQDDASSFPLGGGFNALNLNSQHFAAYLVMTLCREVDKDTLIQLVWGDIEGSQKRERISKQLEAIAKDIKIPPEDATLQSPPLVEDEPSTGTYPLPSTPSPSLASASTPAPNFTPTSTTSTPVPIPTTTSVLNSTPAPASTSVSTVSPTPTANYTKPPSNDNKPILNRSLTLGPMPTSTSVPISTPAPALTSTSTVSLWNLSLIPVPMPTSTSIPTSTPAPAPSSASTIPPTPTANFIKLPSNDNKHTSNRSLFLSLAVLFMLVLWATNEMKSILL